MNRINKVIEHLKNDRKKMLSPYITAGDPHPKLTVSLMHALVNAGADILELGIPFSDPMAEGPVIQRAMERALAHKVTVKTVLEMVHEFRKNDAKTPVVLMGYLNPIEQYGYEQFAKQAVHAGVDATLLVDMPPEESDELARIWNAQGLYSIYLCSPTTSELRFDTINQYAEGYLYYVSLKGVTGSDALDIQGLKEQYLSRKKQTSLPLMVGFGIKTPEIAAQIASFADGVIIGAALISAILSAYEEGGDPLKAGASLISTIRQAIDQNGS
jgi:tryptophan synthase alpha chain